MKGKKKPAYAQMASNDKARLVAGWLVEKKAKDVEALDVSGICPITEALVVATATSGRHAKGLADAVLERVAEEKLEFLGQEGMRDGNWILLDLNDVLVHIFRKEFRELYNLEGLWSEGPRLALDGDEAPEAIDVDD